MQNASLPKLLAHLRQSHPDFAEDALLRLADDIAAAGHERDDPVREIMARLGDRWSALLLVILTTGNYRHAALRRIIAVMSAERMISQRIMTLRLRALERDGLVARARLDTTPPSVTYSLTPLGQALAERLDGMIRWIKENEQEIMAARASFSP